MFGYVKTDYPNLYVKDTVLYKSVYCGLCKSIGKCSGCKGRLTLSYDLAFLSVFTHAITGLDVRIKKQRCILHWFIKRPIAIPDELSTRIGALNVILAYYKITDDVLDEKKGFFKKMLFKSSYKKCKKKEPELDRIVKENYKKLCKLEKENCSSPDIVADPFGNMMQEIVAELLKDNNSESISATAYNLGKWIYLIDAVDDFEKDKKKNNYNVFVNEYKDAKTKEEFLKTAKDELQCIFSSVIGEMVENSAKIDYKFNHDLIDNVIMKGILSQTKKILEDEKCKNTTKF